MAWLWIVLGALVVLVGARHRLRLRATRSSRAARAIDDAAIRQIIEEGSLPPVEEDTPLDLEEIGRAEEEFWDETWEDPEEYRP